MVGIYRVLMIIIFGLLSICQDSNSRPEVSFSLIKQLGMPGQPFDIEINGDYAYVACYYGGSCLQIVNISDPYNAFLAGTCNLPDWAQGVALSGDYAYVADRYGGGLQIVDISDPNAPIAVSSVPGFAYDVFLQGNYAYVTGYDVLKIIDISNPLVPILVGYCYNEEFSTGNLVVAGTYAYVLDYYNKLRVFDIANPYSPQHVTDYAIPDYAHDIFVEGDRIYIADDQIGGVLIVDIANPENPQPVSSFSVVDLYGQALGVYLYRNYLLIGCGWGTGLLALNVSDDRYPYLAQQYSYAASPAHLVATDSLVFTVSSTGNLDIFKWDRNPYATTSLSDSGWGCLRMAMDSAIAHIGPDTIYFTRSGEIALIDQLPTLIDDSTAILGSSAPSGPYSVVLDGSSLSSGQGLTIQSGNNTIEGLTIRNFPGNGISISGLLTANNTVTNNLIYNNAGLAIDLNNDGVTVNDPTDADAGPNDLLNYPEIDSLFMNPDSTFTLYGRATDSAVIEFFVAHPVKDGTRPVDPSGHGEAYSYVGSDTCDIVGDFVYDIPNTVSQFSVITATVTDTLENTSEFCENFVLVSAPLIIVAYSPVNLTVTDPIGDVIGRDAVGILTQTIFPASYTEIVNDSIHINFPILGEYIIDVVSEDGADPEAVYSIGIRINGTENCIIIMDALIPAQGLVTSYTYEVEEGYHYINGDCDINEIINILDIIFMINYKFKFGPEPTNIYACDANCDRIINILDIVYLINYKFKNGAEPCPVDGN